MAKLSKSIVIVAAKRTAFGTMNGALKGVSANDLAVVSSKAALAQSGVSVDEIGHVIIGNVMQTSADAIYCARHIGLKSGLPITTPALTVNRLWILPMVPHPTTANPISFFTLLAISTPFSNSKIPSWP